MDYEQFKETLADDVKARIAETEIGTIDVEFHEVNKVNYGYEAMTVKPEDERIGVNLNVDQLFEKYQETGDYDQVLGGAVDAVQRGFENRPDIDLNSLTDYEAMKSKLSLEVISKETNADVLENVPHKDMEDMAVVYRFVLDSDSAGRSSVLVTNNMLDNYGITPEQLNQDALENAPVIRPAEIKGMSEVMYEIMGPDAEAMGIPQIDPKDEQMFVATVPDKTGGAGVIAYPNFMEEAAEKVGGSYFVLPSSLHEVILVPDDGRMSASELENMVKEVNATQVDPQDKLTDHVYHYDANEHIFELADKFAAREQEKDAEIEAGEKGSVVQDLKDKKKEIAEKDKAKEPAEKVAHKSKEASL
ncbi:DUF5688 family protein [Butyrivibrio sp. INlla14]|uniref:DUF5688 family protein n=1 Tax=Butyrivibrio sp. INlla14 TaxID=1520808 RepID=UPI0008762D81|nr:DUF5688 family protein [Butyrivibrio sp. INlla14]SCY10881.1 hypothetical protein SAMN02910371_01093 [Butyrivibrio sp. INlla14]